MNNEYDDYDCCNICMTDFYPKEGPKCGCVEYRVTYDMEDCIGYDDFNTYNNLKDFLEEVNRCNRGSYHPDVTYDFTLNGESLDWDDFTVDENWIIVGIK